MNSQIVGGPSASSDKTVPLGIALYGKRTSTKRQKTRLAEPLEALCNRKRIITISARPVLVQAD